MKFKQLLVLVWAAFLWQCSSGTSNTGDSGKYCSTSSDCGASGLCVDHQCAKTCTVDADCAYRFGSVCGIAPDQSRKCVEPCESVHEPSVDDTADMIPSRYACVDGVATSCALLDATHCQACGCGANELCTPGVGCGAKLAVGKACVQDNDCKSDNCSSLAGICRVPVGQPCNASNCDYCQTSTDGSFQYCSRTCNGDYACNGGACVGFANVFMCDLKCSAASDNGCPASCSEVTGEDGNPEYFCGGGYDVQHEPQAIGTPCQANADCTSNLCHTNSERHGFCSASCTASKDCPDGYRCADTFDPELRCIPTCIFDGDCSLGACASVTTAEGETVTACSLKKDAGACGVNRDCLSNKCTKNTCAPTSALSNGSSCVSASDCKSMSCKAGYCRGSALLGDACSSSYDCGIGDCCLNGASKNTCSQACD